ncbi:MAG: hypothetical protein J2P41_22815, partial [Blastocatellia bacterium]|nr:hypothetical protein [Blastocatellia bacterium]
MTFAMKGSSNKSFLYFAVVFFAGVTLLCPGPGAFAQSGRKPGAPGGQGGEAKPGSPPGNGQQGQQGQGQQGQGQQGQQQNPDEKPIIKLDTREVVIPLSAYDAEGNYVDDLSPRDVIVLEDNEPRLVTSVKREPANIVLILDLCNEFGTFKNGPFNFSGTKEEK